MSSSTKIDKRKKYIFIFGKGPINVNVDQMQAFVIINIINMLEWGYEHIKMTVKSIHSKQKFNSDDDFPLNKPLKFHAVAIIIRSIFEKNGKY